MSKIQQWLERSGARRIRQVGDNNLVSTCPFHEDSKPSFSMRTDNGLFVCYSEKCGARGNLVNFLISGLGWRASKAREAAEEVGAFDHFPLDTFSGMPTYAGRKQKEFVSNVHEGQLGLYDFCPTYLIDRGFKKAILRSWEIGYDYGSNRVTIPVRDQDNMLVGLTKRSTEDWHEPKYLHLHFKKAQFVYGAHRVKKKVGVVVEGQLDVLAWEQLTRGSGPSPVSTMGAFVTQTHVKKISRQFREIFLVFDNDEAGRAAMTKAGDMLLRKMPRGAVKVLRRWPEGVKDAADFLQRDRILFNKFVSQSEDYSKIRLET